MLKNIIGVLVMVGVLVSPLAAKAKFESEAQFAVLMDYETGAILYDKGAHERMFPSSMTKLMTIYILMDRIKRGSFKMEDTLPVSENAWKVQGSKMFVELGNRIAVKDLLRGIIVQSGNDACVVVAEAISGSEEKFAEEMNRVAAELGMKETHYKNSSGWPDPDHYTTPFDLAILARRIISDFPEYYPVFSELEFTYHKIKQHNRNLLLTRSIGVDGLKTGHTEIAGYGITLSAIQDGRRVVAVVNGLDSEKTRATAGERLILHGFRDFDNRRLFTAGEKVEDAQVWFGKKSLVPLVTTSDVKLLLPRADGVEFKVSVAYNGPIPAPIKKDTKIADLVIERVGMENIVLPLVAGEDIEEVSFFEKLIQKAIHLVKL